MADTAPTHSTPDYASAPSAAGTGQLGPAEKHRQTLLAFQEQYQAKLVASRRRNAYFHDYLTQRLTRVIPAASKVLDVGCGDGSMLAALRPSLGVGVDFCASAIDDARAKYPHLQFVNAPVEDLSSVPQAPFDYIILSGILPQLYDVHTALQAIRPFCAAHTRVIVCSFSRLWQPLIRLSEVIGWKQRVFDESWIPGDEVRNLLAQSDLSIVRQVQSMLLPFYIPIVSHLINRWLAPLPGLRQLTLCTISIARPLDVSVPGVTTGDSQGESVSVLVPVRNEEGNILPLLNRVPMMAARQELIFVEGNSTDDTWQAVERAVAAYNGPMQVKAMKQPGRGKGDAVRTGFAAASGDIFIILDGDLSVPPEELPRFIELITSGKCEFANGSRLVYPMERQAMQFLNMIANKCFGYLFTFLLGQNLRDTLCGTKALRRSDYNRIVQNRAYFGDFDPFGDFDLLFGSARLNLKIMDVPVHYKQRVYGSTNISRFRHGLLLLRMCAFAARKITFV